MTQQQKREIAAAFLIDTVAAIAHQLELDNNAFDFSEYRVPHTCKTIACMEGWLPVIRPDIAEMKGWNVVVNKGTMLYFAPSRAGIPICEYLWYKLTIPGYGSNLQSRSKFEEVAQYWTDTAVHILNGKLDHELTTN